MINDSDRVRFVKYRGKQILLMDYSYCDSFDEIYATLTLSRTISAKLPPKSALALTDVSGSNFDKKIVDAFMETAKHNAPYFRASATVGVTGLKKVILPIIAKFSGRNIHPFDTREEAMAWLVAQDG